MTKKWLEELLLKFCIFCICKVESDVNIRKLLKFV
jgi:hypothetical protein